MTTFAIIGGGWRAEFFLRAAKARPDLFEVAGLVMRSAEKRKLMSSRWDVPAFGTLADLLVESRPNFVVTAVPRDVNPEKMMECVEADLPVLSETPPAADVKSMTQLYNAVAAAGGRVQVAEQYWLQPHQAARLAVVDRGLLGSVTHAQVSVAHGYHGVSLIRRYLGVGFENATINARAYTSPIVEGPGRGGPPQDENIRTQSQTLAWLDFGDGRTAVFDFAGTQYFGWVRSERVLVRGERGELVNDDLRWLPRWDKPARAPLVRQATGAGSDLEGYHLKGYTLGGDWLYENPLAPARLADDEIAVGSCLLRMADYAAGGESFYSLNEACQDHYLGTLIDTAATTAREVSSETQPWATDGRRDPTARDER